MLGSAAADCAYRKLHLILQGLVSPKCNNALHGLLRGLRGPKPRPVHKDTSIASNGRAIRKQSPATTAACRMVEGLSILSRLGNHKCRSCTAVPKSASSEVLSRDRRRMTSPAKLERYWLGCA
jgi:hypothetical protein